MVHLDNDWDEILKSEFEKDYYKNLRRFLAAEYKTHTVYPDMYDIFNALKWTSYADTKVVIFGQDPYHESRLGVFGSARRDDTAVAFKHI